MARGGFSNPGPKTESAREARKSFYCELCQKGYSRMNEFDAHESSYDHQHKKRLKEMKQMQRDPAASDRARKAERREDERSGLISLRLGPNQGSEVSGSAPAASGGGLKKAGFRSIAASALPTAQGHELRKAFIMEDDEQYEASKAPNEPDNLAVLVDGDDGEVSEPEEYQVYNPEFPTSP